jgi:hypothetical protein
MLYLEYEPTADTQEPTASCTHNNTQHTTKNTKHHNHGPPKPPASSSSNFTGECNCRMLRNRSWSLQHDDVTFIEKNNCSVILFTIILQAAARRTCGQKVSFISYYLCFFCATASEQCALTSAIQQYFICQYPTSNSHVSAWFWTRGGGAIVTMFSGGEAGCGCC